MTVLRNLKMTRHLKIVMYLKHLMKNQDCHECFTKNEEQEKLEPRIYTVAASWLSPVAILVTEQLNKHLPPTLLPRGPKRSTPQLVPRARPPRKPPDREINQDRYR